MTGQCLVIVVIILAIAFYFYRAKRKRWALATLPLMLLPAVNAAAAQLCILMKIQYDFLAAVLWILISAVAASIWIGMCTLFVFNRKGYRVWYISIGVGFTVILAAILLMHYCTEFNVL